MYHQLLVSSFRRSMVPSLLTPNVFGPALHLPHGRSNVKYAETIECYVIFRLTPMICENV